MKDHELRELINRLADCAKLFAGTEQLRERIADIVLPVVSAKETVPDDMAKLQAELFDTQHELAIRMNLLHEYPWCCRDAQGSNGWRHAFDCKNFVMCI